MLLNQTAMSKVWFTSCLVTRVIIKTVAINCLLFAVLSRRFYSLTGDYMDPDPTPHPRWSYILFR
ncbi:mgtA regulatory leader peptide MgtL [Raoultella planticola]|uniref:mgtA leader peptide n=1 Tax=Raoultella planticola TaxID=575 RepID=A0A5P6AB31_RAOPL|nr:mgtA regulatory leader peptide MgtL [Raoultella planticola]